MASRASIVGLVGTLLLGGVVLAVAWGPDPPDPVPTAAPAPLAPRQDDPGVRAGGYDWSRLDEALERAVAVVPNTSARMRIERDGEVLYHRRIGVVKEELVPTGSVRKWTTAAALMTLVDDGRLDLDAPVGRYVKAWDVPGKQGVTTRMLLSHTSGIVMRPPRGFCSGLVTLGACVAKAAQLPLMHEPGTRFHYSTMAFNVAARVAENIVGKPWHRFWRETLGEPLGMERSAFAKAGPGLEQMPGMFVTSPEEFGRFLHMLLDEGAYDGQQLLSPEAVREMEQGQTGGVPKSGPIPRQEWWAEGQDYYGLGVWRNLIFEDGAARVVSGEGKYGFVALIDREHGVSAVLSLQYGNRRRVPNEVRVDPVDVIYVVCDVLADAVGDPPEPNPHCLPAGRLGAKLGSRTF